MHVLKIEMNYVHVRDCSLTIEEKSVMSPKEFNNEYEDLVKKSMAQPASQSGVIEIYAVFVLSIAGVTEAICFIAYQNFRLTYRM